MDPTAIPYSDSDTDEEKDGFGYDENMDFGVTSKSMLNEKSLPMPEGEMIHDEDAVVALEFVEQPRTVKDCYMNIRYMWQAFRRKCRSVVRHHYFDR